ncbi:MAG: N-formylglutamate amidohydrolase [Burkholderiales bacterium]|nr:N-formylglutamate amidohydrolase [Burkholderiales bacterium]
MIRLLLTATLAVLPAAITASASDLVVVESGELPIILTAPHGGAEDVPGCTLRTAVGSRFVNRPDQYTDRLARGIADELKRLTGKPPYLVMARFHRKYIDANRRADEAYGDPGCSAVYDAYHAAIRRLVNDIRARHPHAMLFDIHGQAAYPDSILRGTHHGLAVARLLARAGAPAVTGPDSVFGRFAAMGYRIVPLNNTAPTDRVEAPGYTGGHTVALYGSNHQDGIDAMQLEFGRDLRAPAIIAATASDTAQAIAAFYGRYLK